MALIKIETDGPDDPAPSCAIITWLYRIDGKPGQLSQQHPLYLHLLSMWVWGYG